MINPIQLTPNMDMPTLVNAINNALQQIVSENRTKIITDENGIDRIIIGKRPDGTYGIDVSLPGIRVEDATLDQKVMSSDFNLWKIIYEGNIPTASLTPRNTNLTLSGNNIGYVFQVAINILPAGTVFKDSDNLMLNIASTFNKSDLNGSGVYFDDGTNRVIYKYRANYLKNSNQLLVTYSFRLTAGSFTWNPATDANSPFTYPFYYQVANTTQTTASGSGGTGIGDGKYYYYDYIVLNADGTVNTALASSTIEFVNGAYRYFPT